ncbi:DUF3153 domain-containing protein [Paraclostridium sordellii]|uniref:DUF3153 domain-containing protein n=1 Tax=Paraclostridium sordellii TaxID=1505 RepID=UPI0005DEED60|nr:DUF3153 domain-containing protein [Paeniclostridium sordellii]CEN78893.1 Protein of uncharacterised function (DUF3153) [[Clostridium] sordellii] [Paeniclostridium sordellii]CEO10064.1 Protein of uncharacterised function (DUF3153) [[Clostridium] sordellii] [Paeniclostridium sordellii]CEP87711.1 Protein of uncharacterised function (DUF3153) [[Clostridium] sordellii] [Paeniclostridium sordellii]CEP96046.1 Protein of uncharacterised function (DUF3153) [[Clostridium] sordellii] [Paeniclostridium 
MRKFIVLITMIITTTILTGCVNSDITLDVDKKGNASLTAQILSNDTLMKGINENDLKQSYDSVEKITDEGKTGYRITKNLGNITNLDLKNNKDMSKYADVVDINTQNKFFYTIYDVNIKLKDYMKKNLSNEEMGILNLFGSNFHLNFHLNTPIKLISSNATTTSDKDGVYTYNWDYSLGNLENIQASAKIPNVTNILIVSIISIIVVIILAIFIIRKRKIKSKK